MLDLEARGVAPKPAGAVRMPRPGPRSASGGFVAAAVDVGANSVHLLVANVEHGRVVPLADESAFLALGAVVDRDGSLGAHRPELENVLVGFVRRARSLGAHAIALVGTEPMRRAADAGLVSVELERRTGARIDVLSHVEEGFLTAIGATAGRRSPISLLLVDVGGGSTECVVVGARREPVAWGLPLGSARLAARHLRHDPPLREEVEAARAEAQAVVAGAKAVRCDAVVAVGGTARGLARVIAGAGFDRALTHERLSRVLVDMAGEPAEIYASRHGIKARRARLLPAGAAILEAVLSHHEHPLLHVSDAGVREGLALAMSRAGAAWRMALPQLTSGWRS